MRRNLEEWVFSARLGSNDGELGMGELLGVVRAVNVPPGGGVELHTIQILSLI